MASQATSRHTRRVLVIAPTGGAADPLLTALEQQADLSVVHNVDEALTALRDSRFDLIITPSDDLLSAARAAAPETERILRDIGQPVCIVNRSGEIDWSNRRLGAYPERVVEAIRAACADQFPIFDANEGELRTRRQGVDVDREYHFDLTVSPLCDEHGEVERAIGLAWDVSARRRLQDTLNAIDAAGRELVSIDAGDLAQMDVADRLRLLEDKMISCCRDLLHFDHFVILLVEKKTHRLETLVASGIVDAESLGLKAEPENNGICGYVAATGNSYLCADISKDSRYLPGLEGARSSLTVPLSLHDRVIGVLNVESDRMAAFTQEDIQFGEIFGRYIAMGLHMLQLLAVERHATTGQIAAEVDAESATPLNDIVSDVAAIMDAFPGDAGLRTKLKRIIDDVRRVKHAIHVATEPAPIRGVPGERADRDPILEGKRILIADDEDIIRETIFEVLCAAGADASMARDGNEALALLHAQPFDLVLSDIKMPNRNGYEVFAAAKETDARCQVILITGFGYDPNHSVVRASQEGLAGVLFKPFKVDQLMELVHESLTKGAV